MTPGRKYHLNKPHGRSEWMVEFKEQGKRRRVFFRKERDADSFLKKRCDYFAKFGRLGTQLSPEQIQEYLAAKELVGDRFIKDVIQDAIAAGAIVSFKNINDAVREFLKTKENAGRSGDYLSHLELRLRAFCDRFGDWSHINAAALLDWLLQLGAPKTIRNYYGDLSNFCKFALRRKWIDKNPMDEIHTDDLPTVKRGNKGCLTVAQTKTLFAKIRKSFPELLPFYAIQAFAGIRVAEARRFNWNMVFPDARKIVIPAEICKTGDYWTMDALPANIWKYLKKPKDGQWKVPGYEDAGRVRKMAGNWPQNALRHSFCTYHLSLYRDPARTALLLRHTNQGQLYKSYLSALVPKEEARKYFEV